MCKKFKLILPLVFLFCKVIEGAEPLAAEAEIVATRDNSNSSCFTELHDAAIQGCHEKVRSLLDRGAKMECVNCDKSTLLRYARDNGHTRLVEMLLASEDESELLRYARNNLPPRLVEMLLAWGAHEKVYHVSPLDLAAGKGHVKVVEMLLAAEPVDCSKRLDALIGAIEGNHLEIVKMLLAVGEENKAQMQDLLLKYRVSYALTEFSYVNWAIRCSDNVEIIRALLSAGARATTNATRMAASFGRAEVAKMLLSLETGVLVHAPWSDVLGCARDRSKIKSNTSCLIRCFSFAFGRVQRSCTDTSDFTGFRRYK